MALVKKTNIQGWLLLSVIILLGLIALAMPYAMHIHKNHITKKITDKQINNIIESIKRHIDTTDINRTLHWKNYSAMKSEVDLYMGGVVSKLETYKLNETEIRFCILILLNFRQKEIAETIHYSYPSGIKTLKKRIADKLSTTPPELRDFLLHLPLNT